MNFQLKKAERRKAKLRIGLSGPSGSGKTYSALILARGLTDSWDKIALIDTENGSGDLYSHLGEYNTLSLTPNFSPERYIEAIQTCEAAGVEIIIIDSISHEWEGKGGCLEINEVIAKTKFKGNTWGAWSETTPRHQKFIEAITHSPCHIITTVRNKVETMQSDDGGKKTIKKVGTKEITREGFEYELTINFNVDRDGHYVIASKDRTGLFIDRDPFVISQKTGEEILTWNNSGAVYLTPEQEAEKLQIEISDYYGKLRESIFASQTMIDLQEKIDAFKLDLVKLPYLKVKTYLYLFTNDVNDMKSSLGKKEARQENPPVETPKAPEVQSEIKTPPVTPQVQEVTPASIPTPPIIDEKKQERIETAKTVVNKVLQKNEETGETEMVEILTNPKQEAENIAYPPEWDTTHPVAQEEKFPWEK